MSEIVATPAPSAEPVSNEGSNESTEMDLDNPTGAQASALVKKAEAEGKSVKEYLAELKDKQTEKPKDKKHVPDFKRPKKEVEEDDSPEDKKSERSIAKPDEKKEAPKADKPAPKEPVNEDTSIKKYKVKVNGQEVEVDEKELLRGYTHRQAADKAYNEGKMAKMKADKLITYLKNPETAFEILKKLGHDPQELSERYIGNILEEEMLTPEQKQQRAEKRELEQARKQLKALDDMKRQEQEAVEKQRIDKLAKTMEDNFQVEFEAALKQTNLPITKHTINRMATHIYNATQLKTPYKLSALEAAQLVKEDIASAQKNLYGDLDGETLLRTLGDDLIDKALKARGKKVINPTQSLRNPQKGNNDLLNRTSNSRPERKRLFDD